MTLSLSLGPWHLAAAELLGLGNIIRPYLGIRNNILKGVNYGSGAAGILDESGKTQVWLNKQSIHITNFYIRLKTNIIYIFLKGGRYSMNAQLFNHKSIVRRIALLLGGKVAAAEYLNKCIYSITIGSNDYVNNYFLPEYYNSSRLYTIDQFAEILVQEYSRQLQVRTIVFFPFFNFYTSF